MTDRSKRSFLKTVVGGAAIVGATQAVTGAAHASEAEQPPTGRNDSDPNDAPGYGRTGATNSDPNDEPGRGRTMITDTADSDPAGYGRG